MNGLLPSNDEQCDSGIRLKKSYEVYRHKAYELILEQKISEKEWRRNKFNVFSYSE